ncbi:FG-GAP-like repeat-containing protein, partial [Elusimicrobiota bacterium]
MFRNDGGANFVSVWNSVETERTRGIAWGDYDNDGYLDMATTGDPETNRVYRNKGDDTFEKVWNSAETEASKRLAWGDLDNDGTLDLAVANFNAENRIYFGHFKDANAPPSAPGGLSVSFQYDAALSTLTFKWDDGDYDVQGDTDAIYYAIAAATTPLQLSGDELMVISPSSKTGESFALSWTQGSPLLGHYLRPAWKVWPGDSTEMHGVVLSTEPNAGNLMLNTTYYFRIQAVDTGLRRSIWSAEYDYATLATSLKGAQIAGVFETSVTVNWVELPPSPQWESAEGYSLQASTAGDFSGDLFDSTTADVGQSTLTLTGLNMGTTYYFRVGSLNWVGNANRGVIGSTMTYGWRSLWNSPMTEITREMAWGDFDNDGDLDLAAGNSGPQSNRVYRNDGDGTFGNYWLSPESEETYGVAWGDYDGDGDLDLMAGNAVDKSNRLYRNEGDGDFVSAWNSVETESTNSVAWADFDNDGDLDLLAGNASQTNRVYRNEGSNVFVSIWNGSDSDDTMRAAWGDYDIDGDMDFVAANNTGSNRVYRNNGDGTFSTAWSDGEGEQSADVVWGDYDNDGDLDLAVANRNSTTNRVYRGSGNGSFATIWNSVEGEESQSVAWADYDNDGSLDLLIGNYSTAEPHRAYHNNGDDTFSMVWAGLENDANKSLAWGDFNGDGSLDLAAANFSAENRVYVGVFPTQNAAPTAPGGLGGAFEYGATVSTINFTWDEGDYDANGSTESIYYSIAVASAPIGISGDEMTVVSPSSDSAVRFLLPWPGGSPLLGDYLRPAYKIWPGDTAESHGVAVSTEANLSTSLQLNTTYYFRVQAVDSGLRRSTWSDEAAVVSLPQAVTGANVASVHETSATITWTPRPASPQWESAAGYRVDASTANDFSGSIFSTATTEVALGSLQVTGINMGTTYYFRVGSLNWAEEANFVTSGSSQTWGWRSVWAGPDTDPTYGIAMGDFDNDGYLDFATASDQTNRVYRNNGDRTFTDVWNTPELEWTVVLAWGDYDNDGDLDLATANHGQTTNRVYQNNGDATFTSAWNSVETEYTELVAWGDFDNDGDLDIAAANTNGENNRVYSNNGDGTFTSTWVSVDAEQDRALALADYDNDGDLDIAVGVSGASNRIYRNEGDGGFIPAWNSADTENTFSLAWGDFDGDGDPDLAAGNYSDQVNRVYRNDGDEAFPTAWSSVETDDTTDVAWGDYDNDGDLDLLVGNDNQSNRIYRNDGAATFSHVWSSLETERTFRVAWGDIDNDGGLDMVSGDYQQPKRVYRGVFETPNSPLSAVSGLDAFMEYYDVDRATVTFKWDSGAYDANGVTETVHYAIAVATASMSLSGDSLMIVSPSSMTAPDSTFTFTWTQGSPLLGHYLRPAYKVWPEDSTEKHGIILSTGPNAGALMLNTTYYFRVQAIDAGLKKGPWSTEYSFSTLARKVSDGTVAEIFETSATVTWTPLLSSPQEETGEGYIAAASTASDFSGTTYSSGTRDTSIGSLTITGLNMGTTYYFAVENRLPYSLKPSSLVAQSVHVQVALVMFTTVEAKPSGA